MENESPDSQPNPAPSDPGLAKFLEFGDFKTTELQTLIELAEYETRAAGENVIHEGDPSDGMFIILEGRASVFREFEGRRLALAELQTGDFFGELALVDDGPRSAGVEAITPCRLMKIGRDSARALAGVQPAAAIHLLTAVGRSLVERMRSGNQKYLDIVLSGKVPAAPTAHEA